MKRWCCILLVVFLIMGVFTGCQGKSVDYAYTTSTVSKDPLVICVDLETFDEETGDIRNTAMIDFMITLEQTAGLNDAAILFIPPKGIERKTYIDRLRVEIMAGGGPDVFLMAHHGLKVNTEIGQVEETPNLFEYPQKAMENGFFLPLDEYMENHTRFTEWDKQTQSVLAAGRNDEGQQIIPLKYTLPVIVYQKEEFDYTPTRMLSWQDMLHDPELSPYALDLANCVDYWYGAYGDNGETPHSQNYLEYILGELVDFKNEELLFTEEELLERINEIVSLNLDDLHDVPEQDIYSGIEKWFGSGLSAETFNQPITLIPMYNDDGGVTANISAYAAINRNTKRPKEAFSVIDAVMSKSVQQKNKLYSSPYLWGDYRSFLMHEELFQEDTVLFAGEGLYMSDENFKELCEVRDQITGANFAGKNTEILKNLHSDAIRIKYNPETGDTTVEELVHEAYENMQRRVRE